MANDEEHTPDFEDLLAAYDISDASIESSNLKNGNATMPTDHHRLTPINMNFLKEMAFAETQSEACKRASAAAAVAAAAASTAPTASPKGEEDVEITVVENGIFDVRKKLDESCFTMQRSILDLGQAKLSKPKSARKNISTSCSRPLAAPIQKQLKPVVVKARKTFKTLDPKPRANETIYKTPAAIDSVSNTCVSKRTDIVQPSSSSFVRLNGTKEKEKAAVLEDNNDDGDVVADDDDDQMKEDVTIQLYTNALPPYTPSSDPIELGGIWANAPTEGGFTCLDCGDRFLLESSLVNHVQRRSVQISLNCSSCERELIFHNRCALLSHVRTHREKNENVDLCDTTFGPLSTKDFVPCVDERGINDTTNQLESNSKYRCHECNRHCGSSLSLREHFGCSRKRPSRSIHCGQCDMSCQSRCSLTSHRRIHLQKKPFVCPECGQTFSESWDVFHLHLTTVCLHLSRTIGLSCTICKTLTVTAIELVDHIVKCHNLSYHKCKECPMAFKSTNSFNAHRTSIHKTSDVQCLTIHKCPLCDVVFQNSGGLQMHLETHVSELNKKIQFLFRCNVCKVLFEDKKTLGDHLKQTHPSVFKVRCKICRAAFRDRNLLREHKLRKHPELLMEDEKEEMTTMHVDVNPQDVTNEEGTMEYEESNVETKSVSSNVEAKSVSSNTEVTVVSSNILNKTTCKQCGLNFESAQKLRSHRRRTHTSENARHRCAVCREYLPDPESMARHGHIHLEGGFNVCTLCNNLAFATKLGLSRHLDHHASNYTYPLDCVYCGRNLTNFTTAADHWKSEHCVYDFSCDLCDAQFLHLNSLNRHKKRTHRVSDRTKCYPCSICEDFDFPKRSLLVQHLESIHGISSVDIDLSQLIPKQSSPSKSKKATNIVPIEPSPPPPPPPSPPPSKVKEKKEHKTNSEEDEPLRKPRKKSKRMEENNEDQEEESKATSNGHICAKCGHSAKTKSEFLEHIRVHKTERNLCQCLECGICFVAEPSLRKHLSFTHKVKDIERFMAENSYSVTGPGGRRIGGLQRNHNGTGPSTSSPAKSVAEKTVDPLSLSNVPSLEKVFECEVCYNTFETDLSLRTHMRTHGMAFIKIKRVSNVPINEVHRPKPQAETL